MHLEPTLILISTRRIPRLHRNYLFLSKVSNNMENTKESRSFQINISDLYKLKSSSEFF